MIQSFGVSSEYRRSVLMVLMYFMLTLFLNAETLTEPPVWDAATGLFPAAIELARSGFDFEALLSMPNWQAGGPNTYTLSPLTWITALFFILFENPANAIVGLHLLHFLISAITLTALFNFSKPAVGPVYASVITLIVAVFPIYVVQTGYMYFEIPLALTTILALEALAKNQFRRAVFWGFVCATLKSMGLVTFAVVMTAGLLKERSAPRSFKQLWVLIPISLWGLQQYLAHSGAGSGAGSGESGSQRNLEQYLDNISYMLYRLEVVPEILGMVAVVSVVGLLLVVKIAKLLRKGPVAPDSSTACYRLALAFTLILAFVGFFLALSATDIRFWMLPRYTVFILPFLVLLMVWMLMMCTQRIFSSERTAKTVSLVILFVLCGALLANQSGRLYLPYHSPNFSYAERDKSYKNFLFIQQALAEATSNLAPDISKFYPRAMGYFLEYPELGYVEKPIENGYFVLAARPYNLGNLKDYPEHFYVVLSNANHGAEVLRRVVRQAEKDDRYEVRPFEVERHGFVGQLCEIQRIR